MRRVLEHRPLFGLAVGLVLSVACIDRDVVAIDAGEGDLVVQAVVSRTGDVERVVAHVPPARPATLSLGADQRLVSFVVPGRSLFLEDGTPVDAELLGAVTIVPRDATGRPKALPAGSCGRCQAPTERGPIIVHPGDLCALPAIARATGDATDAELSDLRARLLLAWPGACVCTPLEPEPFDGRVTLEQRSPDPAFFAAEAIAVAPSGEVAVLSEHDAAVVDVDGTRHTTRALPFLGPVFGAAGVRGARFVVASHGDGPTREARLDVFDHTLAWLGGVADLPARPVGVRWFAEDDLVVLFGTGTPRIPRLTTCSTTISASQLECATLTPPEVSVAGERIWDVTRLSSGAIVAAGQRGLIAIESLPAPSSITGFDVGASNATSFRGAVRHGARASKIAAVRPRVVGLDGRDVEDFELLAVGNVGARLFVCVATVDAAIATLDDVSVLFDEGVTRPVLRVIHEVDAGVCAGASIVDGRPDQLRFGFYGTAVVVDGAGAVVRVEPSIAPSGLAAPVTRVDAYTGGTVIARGPGGELHRRLPGAEAWALVHGASGWEAARVADVVALGAEHFAFRTSGSVAVISGDGADVVAREASMRALAPGEALFAVEADR
ncbi:hypothetical protein L6R52_41410, partial [Myxococcota bacterium]|nr:hypothetical protein [Myxococcota bacterium]